MGSLAILLSGLITSLAHSLSFQWLYKWLYGDAADIERRKVDDNWQAYRERRYRRIGLCKAALLAAHPAQDLRPPRSGLSSEDLLRMRQLCAAVRSQEREVLVGILLEDDMTGLHEAVSAFLSRIDRFEKLLEVSPGPAFQEVALSFDQLVVAGKTEIAKLENRANN